VAARDLRLALQDQEAASDNSCNYCRLVASEVHSKLLYDLKESESWNSKRNPLHVHDLPSRLFFYSFLLFFFSKQTSWVAYVGIFAILLAQRGAFVLLPFVDSPYTGVLVGRVSEGHIYGKARKIMACLRDLFFASSFFSLHETHILLLWRRWTVVGSALALAPLCFWDGKRFLGIKRCLH